MKLRVTERALADREAIFDYIHARSPEGAATRVMGQLRLALSYLPHFPERGIKTDIEDIRVLFIGRYPYKVFYRVRDDAIEIVHIRHTSRHPGEVE